MVSFTPAQWAIAIRCMTALVEPPSAMTSVMAFSKASFVMMSRGRMPRLIRFITAWPAFSQSRVFSFEIAACADELGRLMPRASIALAMVAGGRERLGQTLYVPMTDRTIAVEVSDMVFFDKEGGRLHG